MTVSALLIDMGNTSLQWRRLEDGVPGVIQGVEHASYTLGGLQELLADQAAPGEIWLASVAARSFTDQIGRDLASLWGVVPRVVGALDSMPGVRNDYRHPEQLGVDRLLAAVAAYDRVRGPVCVVDCGTATTLDFVAADGLHLGGFILPGLQMMRDTLLEKTHIPRSAVVHDTDVLGRDTPSAVAMGARYATVCLIEQFLNGPRSPFGGLEATLFLSGGAAPVIAALLSTPAITADNLVLDGLAVLASQGEG